MKPEQARLLRHTALVVAGLLVLFVAALAAAIVFSTVNPPPPAAARELDRTDLPPLSEYVARNGAVLAYRAYLGDDPQVAIVVHGTSIESSVMNAPSAPTNHQHFWVVPIAPRDDTEYLLGS
jgi:hypothetical protein